MPTQSSQQPNSNNDRLDQSSSNAKLPPQRSRARGDNDENDANRSALFAVNLYRFSTRLAYAAAMRRGELPCNPPFSAWLWLLAVLVIGAAAG